MNFVNVIDSLEASDAELERWLDRIDQYEIDNKEFFEAIDRRNNFDAYSTWEANA